MLALCVPHCENFVHISDHCYLLTNAGIDWEGSFMKTRMKSLTVACLLAGSMLGWQAPAFAGSDHSSDTYAGDYAGGSLPTGTFIFLQYAGFSHSTDFVDTAGNSTPGSHADIYEEFTRFAYFANLGGHPLVWEAEIPFAALSDVNVPPTATNNVANSSTMSGNTDPVLHVTYYFISDAQTQRWFGFTNYVYLPLGNYNPGKTFNVSTPRQFTDVPQIGYTEGLGKFSPALKGFSFDFVGNVSLHSNGSIDPINTPGSGPTAGTQVIYTTYTQAPSYDVRTYLRYNFNPLGFVAVGYEGSWGGLATAKNGTANVTIPGLGLVPVASLPNLGILDDEYERAHFQFQVPLAQDLAIGGDIYHDFSATGGFREDIGAEIRLTKIFFPGAAAAPSGPPI
jgi:hypothetical protein